MTHLTRVYRGGALVDEGFDPGRISDYLEQPDTVVWLDLCEPRPEDFSVIAEEFGLAPLAVEDAMTERQRPKLDRYDDHLFLSIYAVQLDDANQLRSSELAVFAAPRFLITVRKDGRFDIGRVVKAWDDSSRLATHGVGFLLWGLLDVVVDDQFVTVQALDDRLDSLEDLLFGGSHGAGDEVQRRSFALRKSLVLLRRLVTPMREVVNSLLRREMGLVDEELAPYYQDVYDHVLRATEWTEGLRDLVGTIVETNLAMQGNRLNEIMKKLTSYAVIAAVPAGVTGFFGQNVPYPGFGHHAGLIASVLIMLGLGAALFLAFKRNGWV